MTPPIEIDIPEKLKQHNIVRIAAEYGTICIQKGKDIIRFTLYPHDINRTIQGFSNVSYRLHFLASGGESSVTKIIDRSLAEIMRQLISDQWLTLIGVQNQSVLIGVSK